MLTPTFRCVLVRTMRVIHYFTILVILFLLSHGENLFLISFHKIIKTINIYISMQSMIFFFALLVLLLCRIREGLKNIKNLKIKKAEGVILMYKPLR